MGETEAAPDVIQRFASGKPCRRFHDAGRLLAMRRGRQERAYRFGQASAGADVAPSAFLVNARRRSTGPG